MQRNSVSEEMVGFYEEKLCSLADAAYRLAFGITLSNEGALSIVRKAYEEVSSKLETLHEMPENKLRQIVVSECWNAFKADKSQSYAPGDSAVAKALKLLPVEARAAMLAVDVAGLGAPEAADAFQWDEKTFRRNLSEARKTLIHKSLDS